MSEGSSTSLWKPANLLAFIGILMMRKIAKLPLPLLQKLGKALGNFIWYVVPYRKKVGMVNLQACFPQWSPEKRNSVLKGHYQSIGMGCLELIKSWYGSTESIMRYVDFEGYENLEAVRDSGKGALLFTGHYTTMELTGRLLIERFPYSCLFRPFNQPIFGKEMEKMRRSKMNYAVPLGEIGEMVKHLRQGEMFWYSPDQGKEIKQSELVEFFGTPAVTNAVSSRIAKMGRAVILPMWGYRLPNGRYLVKILPADHRFDNADPVQTAKLTNEVIETFIMEAPEQYFWLHKRFKRRGHGLPDLYKNA